ncbi:TolC family protein [Rhodocytophaga rosea]|uniref:TolC family protein n=1 Tax=Rhodocytophaga rosea TaxID=2704465 RepID=A0A6C0GSX4_9BACT|nr:TolC family protein [Rhodocytophaga rosea]QHT71271.1 TolC family protein [Rhodocytophaga rosea]
MNNRFYTLSSLRSLPVRWVSILTLILLAGGNTLWAQSAGGPETFSIKDAIEYANVHNSNIKIARYDESIALQRVNEIRGSGLPQININGALDDRLKIPVQLIPASGFGGGGDTTTGTGGEYIRLKFGTKYNASLTGEVTQQIINPSFWVGMKAAKQSSIYYKQATQQTTEQTAYNISNAYYQVIVAQKQLQLLQTNLTSTQKILANTQLQFKNGVAKKVDVSRLQVNANNLQSQLKQAELSLVQVFNTLKFQMGMPIEKQISLSDTTLTFSEEEPVLSENTGNYVENRIEYKLLETNLKLQELDKKNFGSGYFPTLSAYGNYAYQAQRQQFDFFQPAKPWFESSAIGLRLSIPVFDGLQRNARVQQAKIKSLQIEERMNLTKQNINLEVSNSLTQYRNTLQRIESEQQNVQLAQEVYEVTQLEFREGVGTSTDVVEAETSLRQAQNTYITTLLDLYTARLDLERAKGNLLTYLNSK